MTMRIQRFTPAHQSGTASLITAIQQQEFSIPITLADQPDLVDIPGFYQNGAGNFWVAEYEDRIVGTIALLDIGGQKAALRKRI